jgi:hypothetical protein
MIGKVQGQAPEGQDQVKAESDGEQPVDKSGFHDGFLSGRLLSRSVPELICLISK